MIGRKYKNSSSWDQDVIVALEKIMDEREKQIDERLKILRAFIEERMDLDRKTAEKYFDISKVLLETHVTNSDKMLEQRMGSLDERFRAVREMQDKVTSMADAAINAAIASSREAIAKAEVSTEKRFDAVNELRNSLNEVSNKMMPRPEVESAMKSMDDKVRMVSSRLDQMTGAEQHGDKSSSTVISIIAIVIAALVGLSQFVISREEAAKTATVPAPYTQTIK
jgi:hypothetical protein